MGGGAEGRGGGRESEGGVRKKKQPFGGRRNNTVTAGTIQSLSEGTGAVE